MAEQEACSQPGGLLLTGLLPNEAGNATRVLDSQRVSKLEERIAELIACIQPNWPSEVHRNAVAKYVQSLIMSCNPCEVFTFGSVPLKTYLPDGDIDLIACSTSEDLKDTWGNAFLQLLENEGKSESAEFRVKEVHYIQAEVKIIKCLIEKIVVDISFNQVGGLCTLCFLDEVDHLISQNHLFKRSIILIKAWCYYESRIIGAYFGLISTYALEILILYIFHVFNGAFAGPFEVLYRFLQFFSNFDWDNFCVSIWGPVPISSLPDMTAEFPRKDGGKLLFDKHFLEGCITVYAVSLTGQENQGQQFVSKHFNVIDPLRTSNNLGRSVNKGNFRRIRSAFAFGAKKLANLLDCPEENLIAEVDQFFINTWKRHGSNNRPDVPISSIRSLQPLINCPNAGSDNSSIGLKVSHVHQGGQGRASGGYASDALDTNTKQAQWAYRSANAVHVDSSLSIHSEKNQEMSSTDHSVNNNGKSTLRFSRARSCPELTRTFTDVSSHIKHNRSADTSKLHNEDLISGYTSRRIIMDSEIPSVRSARFSFDDLKLFRRRSSIPCPEVATVSTIISHSYLDDSGSTAMRAGPAYDYTASQLQQQKEQDLVNITASSHLPLPLSPVLASTDYAQRKLTGSFPSNITLMNPSRGSGMQLIQDFNSFTNSAQKSSEEAAAVNKNSSKSIPDDDAGSIGGFETENEGLQIQSGETQNFTASRYNYIPTLRGNASCTSVTRGNDIVAAESSGRRDVHPDAFQYQTGRAIDLSATDSNENLTFVTSTQSGSFRRNHSSDTTKDLRVTQTESDKWLRKPYLSEVTTSLSGNLSSGQQFDGALEHISSSPVGDESGDFFPPLSVAHSYLEGHAIPLTSPLVRNQVSGYEAAQISVADTSTSRKPVVVGSSLQRVVDNSSVSLAVDPVGPLYPFSTERSAYNFPADRANSLGSINQFDEDGGEQNYRSPSYQDIDIAKKYNHSEDRMNSVNLSTTRAAAAESSEVLDGDFASHWQNLQYGRLCQNTPNYGSYFYHLPVMVPSVYLQGYYPQDSSIGPSADNINFLNQTMGYDPRLVQFASPQPRPSWPSSGYDRYENERPSFRPGTGTYANPRPFFRDRRFSGRRNHRGRYNYVRVDRKDTEGRRINSQAQSGSLPAVSDDQRPSDVNQTSRTNEQRHGAADRGGSSAHSSYKKPSSPHNQR